ncbi:MAG: hypothetical protein MZW92_26300 [Comamonadaceae bacterium]|nr:hypothetical protein [Comamonadaceae bacterium]
MALLGRAGRRAGVRPAVIAGRRRLSARRCLRQRRAADRLRRRPVRPRHADGDDEPRAAGPGRPGARRLGRGAGHGGRDRRWRSAACCATSSRRSPAARPGFRGSRRRPPATSSSTSSNCCCCSRRWRRCCR